MASTRAIAGLLYIPNLAATWRVNWGLVDAIAFTAYGNGGVNTRYKDIANPNCPIGLTRRVLRRATWNRTRAELLLGRFCQDRSCRAFQLASHPLSPGKRARSTESGFFAFASSDPANFSNRGTDESWGAGARGGIEWKARAVAALRPCRPYQDPAWAISTGIAGCSPTRATSISRPPCRPVWPST